MTTYLLRVAVKNASKKMKLYVDHKKKITQQYELANVGELALHALLNGFLGVLFPIPSGIAACDVIHYFENKLKIINKELRSISHKDAEKLNGKELEARFCENLKLWERAREIWSLTAECCDNRKTIRIGIKEWYSRVLLELGNNGTDEGCWGLEYIRPEELIESYRQEINIPAELANLVVSYLFGVWPSKMLHKDDTFFASRHLY